MSLPEPTTPPPKPARTAGPNPRATLQAALLMLLVAGLTAIDTALVRVLSGELHAFTIVFYRSLFGLVAVTPWLWRHRSTITRTANFRLHLGRALLKLLALFAFFQAIAGAPLASVTAIAFTTPLVRRDGRRAAARRAAAGRCASPPSPWASSVSWSSSGLVRAWPSRRCSMPLPAPWASPPSR